MVGICTGLQTTLCRWTTSQPTLLPVHTASLTLPSLDKTAVWCTACPPCIQTAQHPPPQALALAAQIALAMFVWFRTGQSHDAGSMVATDGNFRLLATSSGTSERNPARQPRPPAPTVAQNSPEQRHATVTLCTTSASNAGTPEPGVLEGLALRLRLIRFHLRGGRRHMIAARIANSHLAVISSSVGFLVS